MILRGEQDSLIKKFSILIFSNLHYLQKLQ